MTEAATTLILLSACEVVLEGCLRRTLYRVQASSPDPSSGLQKSAEFELLVWEVEE
jgi:hypothetical protein